MSRVVAIAAALMCCNALLVAVCDGVEQGAAAKTTNAVDRVNGATTPEKLAEKFFVALRDNDKELALSAIATPEILRKALGGDGDLAAVLELNEHLQKQFTDAFAKFRAEATGNGFDWSKATIDGTKVSLREGDESNSFGSIRLQIKIADHPHRYEIEFDDGLKLSDRWYFTDRIRGFTKVDSSN